MKSYCILLFAVICFISISCKKDDPAVIEPKFGCKLIKLANETGEYVEFTYDGDRLSGSSVVDKNGKLYEKSILVYDSKGYIQRINFYKDGLTETDPSSYWDMKVDGQGRIIESKLYSKINSNSNYETSLYSSNEYNDKGQISKITSDPTYYRRYVYDTNGNAVKSYDYNSSNKVEYLSYQTVFDTKLNPANNNPLYQYLLLFGFFDVYSTNNVLEAKYYNYDGGLRLKTTCSYTYNDRGYPAEVVRTDSSNYTISTQKSIYTYSCN
ncbi:hypothetical protein [Xanthocytophaga flava]|uniref:hypothetical protein n=1 Tax=Xanthocytophaga flava TaxID=3048013 RepID=UPI0028D26727|nr:hypothetical protein [Xanthocytophaga flavus]MDJ1473247.1 hypothetical protein [Xanthocytophaga flavus]